MSLDKKTLLKKRQRKELKRNKKRKEIINKTRRGFIPKLNELQRLQMGTFLNLVRNGKVTHDSQGRELYVEGNSVRVRKVSEEKVTT